MFEMTNIISVFGRLGEVEKVNFAESVPVGTYIKSVAEADCLFIQS